MKPYFQTDRCSLYEGDCRIVMRDLSDLSVDSVVTDPPYELGFMGKGWDRSGIAYDVSVWSECLRVLKPGGHLLAFGGSRTYHRLACAIEDAGFEIRDQIQYIYGSGFPKSLNVSKNLRQEGSVCICNEHNGNLRGLQNRIPNVEGVAETSENANLFATVQREAARRGMGQARLQGSDSAESREPQSGSTSRPAESGVEGRSNVLSQTRELCANQVCPMPSTVSADGSEGWLCDGAPLDHGPMDRASANPNGSSASRRSQPAEQSTNEPLVMAGQSEPQTSGAWPLCGRCGKSMVPNGLGSALKPAHEPIVLARKPFNSTLIQNVLQHGTGGLNIDGCRIATSETLNAGSRRLGDGVKYGLCEPTTEYEQNPNGRWPANVCHDGSNDVLAAFPDAPGQQAPLRGTEASGAFSKWSEGLLMRHPFAPRNDSGSAARFFYCAKASNDDREDGLNGVSARFSPTMGNGIGGKEHDPQTATPKRNFHPTVKPTDLMRYLCRLVTPPNGVVLDPFCGSGSTGKAAMLEGLKFIGIELSAEYCELAQRRIEAVTKQGLLFATA